MESSTASTWTRTFLQSATESLRHVPNTCGATRISNPSDSCQGSPLDWKIAGF